MRRQTVGLAALVMALAVLAPTDPARADGCAAEIAALFDGGALDGLARPSRHETHVLVAADGTVTPRQDVTVETILRYRSVAGGAWTLVDGARMWSGTAPDGPWTPLGTPLPGDMLDRYRDMQAATLRNMTEAECLGAGDLGGLPVVAYRYRSRTDPGPEGQWWGGLYTAYVDPATGLLHRLDTAEMVASWQATPSPDTEVITMRYDPSIRIAVPE
jgi:hypothetical protein